MISVLLPTYNQAAFLPDALAGLATQTRRDFELIVCDDGSTDGTADILKTAKVRTITHGANRGTAAAINSAAVLAAGDCLTWVSSDNVMHPQWLATLAAALEQNPNWGAAYSSFRSIGTDGREKIIRQGPYNPAALIGSDNCYFGPSFLIRREVWQEHRGLASHDYDNWARVEEACLAAGLTLWNVDEALCDYHHGGWNTARRYPELYDAPHWREEAMKRRSLEPART